MDWKLGRPDRLELEEMDPSLRTYLEPRVQRLGYLGELFKCTGHAPSVLLAFMQFTDALKQALPDRLTEAVVLTTATLMGNRYELHQHERLCVRLGFGREWVRQVEALDPDRPGLMTDGERCVQRYALAVLRTQGHSVATEMNAMLDQLAPQQAMAMVLLVGRYVAHAFAVNSLQLEPPVPSIWEDGFDGASTVAPQP